MTQPLLKKYQQLCNIALIASHETIIIIHFQAIIHDLTEKCWEACIDRPGPKMDGKSENCLKNCVQRFLDTNIAVTQNLEKKMNEME